LSERPYRGAMSREEALEELRHCSGSQFDPKVVEKFVEVAGQGQTKTEQVVQCSTEEAYSGR
jgi:HD-GYP domain-containing protein (c-di-GMP phosphodiesterase class II)